MAFSGYQIRKRERERKNTKGKRSNESVSAYVKELERSEKWVEIAAQLLLPIKMILSREFVYIHTNTIM